MLANSVKVDESNNPYSAEEKETICYGRRLDDFFVKQNKINKETKKYGERLPAMYFGAHNGIMRLFPALQSKSCNTYDPRKRPWYIAASSGPKDIIIILDVSGSM